MAKQKKLSVLLLGPGKSKKFRRQIRKELRGKCKIRIMEDEDDIDGETLDEKYDRLLDEADAAVAVYLKNAGQVSVSFEVGYICGKYSAQALKNKIMIVSEPGYDFDEEDAYVQDLFPKIIHLIFNETKKWKKCSVYILKWINNVWKQSI